MLAALREKFRNRRASRAQWKAEKLANDYGYLSEREKHAERHKADLEVERRWLEDTKKGTSSADGMAFGPRRRWRNWG